MRIARLLANAVLLATSVPAIAQGDFIVRLRALMVAPTEKSGPVEPAFPGARVGVTDCFAPEKDFTCMKTTKHHVTGRGPLDGVGRLAGT